MEEMYGSKHKFRTSSCGEGKTYAKVLGRGGTHREVQVKRVTQGGKKRKLAA